jgi:hypothetical protein
MKIEKRLIAYSAIALMVGIAAISPLVFLISAKAETVPKPWFSLDIPYAYFEAGNGSLKARYGSNGTMLEPSPSMTDTEYYRSMVVFNYTYNVNLKEEADDRAEYYQVEIASDKALIMNTTYCLGTYGTFITEDFLKPDNFYFNRSDWFDTSAVEGNDIGRGGVYSPHNITFTSKLMPEGRAGEGTTGRSGTSTMKSKILEASILTITIRRLGWITFSANSTTAIRSNEVIAQVTLEKFSNGFLYNNFIPSGKLSQIDLANPVTIDPNTGLYVPKLNP